MGPALDEPRLTKPDHRGQHLRETDTQPAWLFLRNGASGLTGRDGARLLDRRASGDRRLEHIEQVHADLAFAGNMPINVAFLGWEEPGDPARWKQLRRAGTASTRSESCSSAPAIGLLVAAGLKM